MAEYEKLDRKFVDALLDKLANDDGFRKRILADAKAALAEIEGAPTVAGPCLQPKALLEKEQYAQARDTLRDGLLGFGTHTPLHLEPGGPNAAR